METSTGHGENYLYSPPRSRKNNCWDIQDADDCLMLFCSHCGEMLTMMGETVVACTCEGARQADLESKHKRKSWLSEYQKATDEQRATERKNKKR